MTEVAGTPAGVRPTGKRPAGLVRRVAAAPDVPQLVAAVEEADSSDEKADAIIRLAIGMPMDEAPRDALRIILDAYTDSDPAIRRAAIVSALFLKRDDVGPAIEKLEKEDPVEQLRHQARFFLSDVNTGDPAERACDPVKGGLRPSSAAPAFGSSC